MALDFSKFIVQPASADWLSKVPEYQAAGAKTAATLAKDNLKALKYPDISTILPSGIAKYVPPAQMNQISEILFNGYKGANELNAGGSPGQAQNSLYQTTATVKNTISAYSQLPQIYNRVEEYAKKAGVDEKALYDAVKNYLWKDKDNNDLPYYEALKNTDPDKVIHDVTTGYGNIFNTGGYTEAAKSAKSTSTTNAFDVIGSKGQEKKIIENATVPSNIFGVTLEKDQKGNPTGGYSVEPKHEEFPIQDPKLQEVYKSMGIEVTPNGTIKKLEKTIYDKYNTTEFIGVEGYNNQEAAKFQAAAEKAGIQTTDGNGNITPDFQAQMDAFKRATAYNQFNSAFAAGQAGATKISTSGKNKAAQEKKGLNINIGITKKEEVAADENFNEYLNKAPRDKNNSISIKDKVSGLENNLGIDYGLVYDDIRIGKDKKGNDIVYLTDKNGKSTTKSWADFYTDFNEKSKKIVLVYIQNWLKKNKKITGATMSLKPREWENK